MVIKGLKVTTVFFRLKEKYMIFILFTPYVNTRNLNCTYPKYFKIKHIQQSSYFSGRKTFLPLKPMRN